MCGEPIGDAHQHVVNLESRTLMCTCRGCYLLFTAREADLRYRAVPERYLSFDDFAMGPAQWEALEIPVGLAFFFKNSVIGQDDRVLPRPGGRHGVRAVARCLGHGGRGQPADRHHGPRCRGAADPRAGARTDRVRLPPGPDRRVLRARRTACVGCGAASTVGRTPTPSSTRSSTPSRRGAGRPCPCPRTARRPRHRDERPRLRDPRHRRRAVRSGAAADGQAADRGVHRDRSSTRSRCAARSRSSRNGVATSRRRRLG